MVGMIHRLAVRKQVSARIGALPPDFLPVPLIRLDVRRGTRLAAGQHVTPRHPVCGRGRGRLILPAMVSETDDHQGTKSLTITIPFGSDIDWRNNSFVAST